MEQLIAPRYAIYRVRGMHWVQERAVRADMPLAYASPDRKRLEATQTTPPSSASATLDHQLRVSLYQACFAREQLTLNLPLGEELVQLVPLIY